MDRNAMIGVLFFLLMCLLPVIAKISRDVELEQRRSVSAPIVSPADFDSAVQQLTK